MRLFNEEKCSQLRRGKSEEWKVRWENGEALKPGKWGEKKDMISGGMVISELKAVQAGNKELSLALLLLSPPGLGKTSESSDEDEEKEKEEDGGGGKRKAKGEAKGGSKKKAKKGRTAAEGGSSGVLDHAAMMRQWEMMSPEDRKEFFKNVNESGDV